MELLTAIIPDPSYYDGDKRKEIYAETPSELVSNIRAFINECCYGASDVGSLFNVYRDGVRVATATYNGKFHWADPLYAR